MITNLTRSEEIKIKEDIHEIAKSLVTISSTLTDVSITGTTEKKESTVKGSDPFFGKIHMSEEHMNAWERDFNVTCISLMGLMEECAELQQAASKYYRKYRDTDTDHCTAEKAAMIEEMAHVLIDIRMNCYDLGISPEEIQQEIYRKYPEGYRERDDGSK